MPEELDTFLSVANKTGTSSLGIRAPVATFNVNVRGATENHATSASVANRTGTSALGIPSRLSGLGIMAPTLRLGVNVRGASEDHATSLTLGNYALTLTLDDYRTGVMVDSTGILFGTGELSFPIDGGSVSYSPVQIIDGGSAPTTSWVAIVDGGGA